MQNSDRLRTKRLGALVRQTNIYGKLFVYFVGTILGLYGVYEVLDHFNINLISILVRPIVLFILAAALTALVRYVIYLLNLLGEPGNSSSSPDVNEMDDSLIEMLKDAEAHSRWAEIIKIGSALSDVLWFTSRKKLRVTIGGFVQLAASQLNDEKTLASTLIEDLGNTVMGLGDPDKGMDYIRQGIEIAKRNNYPFLLARGYRNLANCYALKNDPEHSQKNLDQAIDAAKLIVDEAQRLEAQGGIEYARCKTLEHSNRFDDAITALDASLGYYTDLEQRYPDTHARNQDRLVKVYREKGIVYLKMGRTDKAKNAFLEGLRAAERTLNHDNIVRCCVMLAEIMISDGEVQPAEGMLSIAQQHIDKIDTPSIRKEYFKLKRRLEIEVESRRYLEA